MSAPEAQAHADEVLTRLVAAGTTTSLGLGHGGPSPADLHASDDAEARAGITPGDADELETHGTAWGAASSSFCFFASGALVPVLPYLFGVEGAAAVVVASVLVGIALLATGAVTGLLSGTSPLTRALRQLAIGFGAAAVTYALGLLFGTTVS